MKKMIVLLTALVLAAGLAAVSAFAETLDGGWEITAADDVAMTEEAQAAFEHAMEKLLGAEYEPAALLGTQIVAGKNYCVLCRKTVVSAGATPVWALVYIYSDLQGNAEILNICDLHIGEFAYPAE